MSLKNRAEFREIFMYLLFGGLTTAVNTLCYFLASWGLGFSAWLSTVVAWVFAVCFAFVTNKLFVFQSKEKVGAGREAVLFFTTRGLSLAINVVIMFVFVDVLHLFEPLIFVIAQGIVLVFNYVASKWFVFRKDQTE